MFGKNIIMQSGLAGIEARVLKDLEKHLVDTKSYEKQMTLRANADCLNENIVYRETSLMRERLILNWAILIILRLSALFFAMEILKCWQNGCHLQK